MSEENMAVSNCQCNWLYKVKGGEPLSVAVCMLCGAVNWPLLKEDFEKAAREYARTVMETHYGRHDYPDGSRTICASGMYNIKKVYNLFAMDTGQNLAAPVVGAREIHPVERAVNNMFFGHPAAPIVVHEDEEIIRDDEGGIRIVKRGYV